MSRIGKKLIAIPEKTEVTVSAGKVSIKGPKGSLERVFGPEIDIKVSEGNIALTPHRDTDELESIRGTYAAHVNNMIEGVTKGFTKKLIIEGIGYKADVKGTDLVMALGFSHPVVMKIPATLKVTSDKGTVVIAGMDRDEVGQFSAEIRAWKKPEPYKGKGIRYEKEVIRRKQGKKSV